MSGRNGIALLLMAVAGVACESGPDESGDAEEARASQPGNGGMDLDPPGRGLDAADTVVIIMRDGGISPTTIRLRSGRNTVLQVRNDGSSLHELMIGREPVYGTFTVPFFRGIAADFAGPVIAAETEAGVRRHESSVSDETEEADSLHYQVSVPLHGGDQAHISFVPPQDKRGQWWVGCVTLDHYERGERGIVIIE